MFTTLCTASLALRVTSAPPVPAALTATWSCAQSVNSVNLELAQLLLILSAPLVLTHNSLRLCLCKIVSLAHQVTSVLRHQLHKDRLAQQDTTAHSEPVMEPSTPALKAHTALLLA